MKLSLAPYASYLQSVMRIMVGLMFLEHGTSKLLGFPHTNYSGVPLSNPAGAAGLFELIGGALIVLGLFTRPVAFVLSGMCAVAYFMVHAPQNFFPIINMGEAAIVYSFVFIYLAGAGAGPWSLDALRTNRAGSTVAAAAH